MDKYKDILKKILPDIRVQEQIPCYHPYLLTKRKTGEKVCISCRRTIYISNKLNKTE